MQVLHDEGNAQIVSGISYFVSSIKTKVRERKKRDSHQLDEPRFRRNILANSVSYSDYGNAEAFFRI